MSLSFSFLPEDFVTAMRDMSWSIFGDEDLLLFLVTLALPGVLIVLAVAVRVRRNYHRVRFADGAPRRPEEYHTSSDSSRCSESDDERNFMTLDEMLTATLSLASHNAGQRAVRAKAEKTDTSEGDPVRQNTSHEDEEEEEEEAGAEVEEEEEGQESDEAPQEGVDTSKQQKH